MARSKQTNGIRIQLSADAFLLTIFLEKGTMLVSVFLNWGNCVKNEEPGNGLGDYIMSKKKATPKYTYVDAIMENPIAIVVVAVLAIILGIIFIVSQSANKPITHKEAIYYSGYFDHYDNDWDNYREIHFEDGTVCDVFAHTETVEFSEKMESLPKSTRLDILINPNNDYVAEIRTDTEELLNFETSQQEIYEYGKGYVWIGVFAGTCGVFLLWYAIASVIDKRREEARHKEKGSRATVLRYADTAVKSRTLLEANVQGYQVCYRRVKSTNELVINGRIYDERKGIIEFAHKLCATVDGHKIEVGYDKQSFSYIRFDGKTIQQKKRWI